MLFYLKREPGRLAYLSSQFGETLIKENSADTDLYVFNVVKNLIRST